jgi:hypothetical protein
MESLWSRVVATGGNRSQLDPIVNELTVYRADDDEMVF